MAKNIDENDVPEVRNQFTEVMKAKDLAQIGEGHLEPRAPGFAEALASAQQARERRQAKARARGGVVNLGSPEASESGVDVTPEPTTEAEAARLEKERAAGRGPAVKTGILRPGTAPAKPKSKVNEKNNQKRLEKGMGYAGEEDIGDSPSELNQAYNIILRKHNEAKALGKIPADAPHPSPELTPGSHEHRVVKVMSELGVGEKEAESDPLGIGGTSQSRVAGIHHFVQAARDKRRTISQTPEAGDYWEHPTTGEVIPVAANHPDMPASFTREKGATHTYSRGRSGQLVLNPEVYLGWNREKRSGGSYVFKQRTAPAGNVGNVVDYIRNAYQNPETASLKAAGTSAFHNQLFGGSRQSSRITSAVPNLRSAVPLTQPLPNLSEATEAGEGTSLTGVSTKKKDQAGMPTTGIPEARSGKARVRKVAPRPSDKGAAAAKAREESRSKIFGGPRPEESAGQMALPLDFSAATANKGKPSNKPEYDFTPTEVQESQLPTVVEGPIEEWQAKADKESGVPQSPLLKRRYGRVTVTSNEKVTRIDRSGKPLPAPLGKKQITISQRGSKEVTLPRTETAGAASGGVGPGEAVERLTIHPDTHQTINIADNSVAAPNPIAEGRPSGTPVRTEFDEKNQIKEGTGVRGGLGYEQPELPLFATKGGHRNGTQWSNLLGGQVVKAKAGKTGKTTSEKM
jgi:hypothetical protein